MKNSKAVVFGAAVVLSLGIAGCSSDQESSTAGTSAAPTTAAAGTTAAAAPAASEYTKLLIKPGDIDADWTLRTTKPEQNGITGIYGNGAGTEKITTAVVVRDSAATAAAAAAAAKTGVVQQAGGAFTPIPVGVDGGILNGSNGTTVVVFAEGPAFAIIEFNSKTGEAVPAEVAIAIAERQDAVIKNGVK
ncbi:hypothetical protein [Nocardia yamanashiensis]|uniref:hypothetical protein n=1 Tax=Nocardia yamanashiensis TaxID=209247 RepID=UPI00082B346F|nr:hypothetical protein [Nocardia yamanashiensis]